MSLTVVLLSNSDQQQEAEVGTALWLLMLTANDQISDLMTACSAWEKPLTMFLRVPGPGGIRELGSVVVAWPKTSARP